MIHRNPLLSQQGDIGKFITVGEIMLRLTPPDYGKIRVATSFEASYGGSEANIALALANLGIDSTFFTVVPNNSLGKSAVRMLRSNDTAPPSSSAPPRRPPLTGWAPTTWRPATASAPARSPTTASTAPLPSTTSARWICPPCWRALTGST